MQTQVEQFEVDNHTLLTVVTLRHQDGSEEVRCSTHSRVKLRLATELRSYQRDAIKWVLQRGVCAA